MIDESSTKQSSNLEDDPLSWAKEAYARLKQQQEGQKSNENSDSNEVISSLELESETFVETGLNEIDVEIETQREERKANSFIEKSGESNNFIAPTQSDDEPILGDFDDVFTWSAEVLAAQGVKSEQISLEKIDWLSEAVISPCR